MYCLYCGHEEALHMDAGDVGSERCYAVGCDCTRYINIPGTKPELLSVIKDIDAVIAKLDTEISQLTIGGAGWNYAVKARILLLDAQKEILGWAFPPMKMSSGSMVL